MQEAVWTWDLTGKAFRDNENSGPFDVPNKLPNIKNDNISYWFNVSYMRDSEKRLRQIHQMGYEFFSFKTRRYLNNFPQLPLDPEIMAEIRAFIDGRGQHKQSLWVAGKEIKGLTADNWLTLMSHMLDWTLWYIAGLNPTEGEGKILAQEYLSPEYISGMKRVGRRTVLNYFEEFQFKKALQDASLEQVYGKIVQAAWQWMYYDSLYNSNFSSDLTSIKPQDIYWEVFPFHEVIDLQKGKAEKDYQLPYYWAKFIRKGMKPFMPYYLQEEIQIQNGGFSERISNKIGTFFKMFNGKPEDLLTQWHVNLVYEALSAAKAQGMGPQAEAIWVAFRDGLATRGFLRKTDADRGMAASRATGGIDLTKVDVGKDSGSIKFHIDAAMLQELQDAPGLTPVIISILPMGNLRQFLEIASPLRGSQ
jgi:hypothetical protein